jgi:hypothetical protein
MAYRGANQQRPCHLSDCAAGQCRVRAGFNLVAMIFIIVKSFGSVSIKITRITVR